VVLNDRRIQVIEDDVLAIIRRAPAESYDAILLDVDNGPGGALEISDARLYSRRGLSLIRRSLKRNGKAAFWSAAPDRAFAENLARSGFLIQAYPAKVHERSKYAAHLIYVGCRT
jgi:spermidine synthase